MLERNVNSICSDQIVRDELFKVSLQNYKLTSFVYVEISAKNHQMSEWSISVHTPLRPQHAHACEDVGNIHAASLHWIDHSNPIN